MHKIRNDSIEERIHMEIIVDAYDDEERAMGWFYYLQDTIEFPFQAKVIAQRKTSPLTINQIVEVVGMANEEECLHEMLVEIAYEDDTLSIPLAQLKPIKTTEATQQAVADWHYWINQGYTFG